jgi:hypothetical protein
MVERKSPQSHLELTIRYTIRADRANIGALLDFLKAGEDTFAPEGGHVELLRVKPVSAPE